MIGKSQGSKTGGAIHKPEAPPSRFRQERRPNTESMSARTPATRRRMPAKAVDVETYSHLDPDSSTQASTCPPSSKGRRNRYEKRSTSAVPSSSPSASICRQRQRHPRTGMETASIQPSRDDDVARVPASIFVFPPDRFLGAPCHGARRGVNGPRDPCGAPRVPLTPRRAPRQRAVVTNRKGKRR